MISSYYNLYSDADCDVYKTPYIRADPLDPNSLAIANWARSITNDVRALKNRLNQTETTISELIDQVRSNSHKIDLLHVNTVILAGLTEDISYALTNAQQVNSICDTVNGFTDSIAAIPVVGSIFSLGINALSFGCKMYADSLPRDAVRDLASFRANVLSSTFNDMIHRREHKRFIWASDDEERTSHLEDWFNTRSNEVSQIESKNRNPEIPDAVQYYKIDEDPHRLGMIMPIIHSNSMPSTVSTIVCDTSSGQPTIQHTTAPLQGAKKQNILMSMFYSLLGNRKEKSTFTRVGMEPLATTGDIYSSRLQNFGKKILSYLPIEMDDVSSIIRSFIHNGGSK